MRKREIEKSLADFYGRVGSHETFRPLQHFEGTSNRIEPWNFTIVGGASMILQGWQRETSDIDMLANYDVTLCLREVLQKEGISWKHFRDPEFGDYNLAFNLSGQKFDVLKKDFMEDWLSGDILERRELHIGDMPIYVRPHELVRKDYSEMTRKAYDLKGNQAFREEVAQKYRKRVRGLNRRYIKRALDYISREL